MLKIKIMTLLVLCIALVGMVSAQGVQNLNPPGLISPPNAATVWCSKPNPKFCPGNRFTNGDFEIITGDPEASADQDIGLATGWSKIWASDKSDWADLYCRNGTNTNLPVQPTPDYGGVYAGMWICSSSGTDLHFREGMFNILTSAIPASPPKTYSISFDLARLNVDETSGDVEIGIYGVNNPSNNLGAQPTSMTTPTNLNLFGPVKTVRLGVIIVSSNATKAWVNKTIIFNPSSTPGFPANGITHILITRNDGSLPSPYRRMYMAFDNFCMHEGTASVYCCSGENLVKNGNFEDGNTGFVSNYQYRSLPPFHPFTNWVAPGQYSIVKSADAQEICGQWIVKDHSACNNGIGEKFMVVNGKTQQSSNGAVIWQQTVATEKDSNYKFCAYFRNLAQCCFDITPNVTITFDPGTPIPATTINVDAPPCGWQLLDKTFTATSASVTIKIILDETGNGDGNDLAIDDISLQKVPQAPQASTQVSFSTSFPSQYPGYYNVTATQPPPPIAGGFSDPWNCGYYWRVSEIDAAGNEVPGTIMSNPSTWWTYPSTKFPGYNGGTPGLFKFNKMYRITYGVWCKCLTWTQSSWVFEYNAGTKAAKPTIRPDEKYKLPPGSIEEIIKNYRKK